MAQEFSMRVPLIDGQGNFGSVDGDPPAAERYTEVRLAARHDAARRSLRTRRSTIRRTMTGASRSRVVLPAKFPNLSGQRRRAASPSAWRPTSAAQSRRGDRRLHRLSRQSGALNRGADRDRPGPDFPTGGLILGRAGIRSAYHKGRGSILMRGRVATEILRKEREALVITEIPYQVNKATMVERSPSSCAEKKIEGISDIRDESSRDGMRVVIELKRDAMADVVLNQLYRFSTLQSTLRRQHGCADRRPASSSSTSRT
jgi:DNA gyrase subunit A